MLRELRTDVADIGKMLSIIKTDDVLITIVNYLAKSGINSLRISYDARMYDASEVSYEELLEMGTSFEKSYNFRVPVTGPKNSLLKSLKNTLKHISGDYIIVYQKTAKGYYYDLYKWE